MDDNKDLTDKYRENYLIIREEINLLDPIGLNPGEVCPIDEYDPEITRILTRIYEVSDYRQLAEEIKLIFNDMFCDNLQAKVFEKCAKKIFERRNI